MKDTFTLRWQKRNLARVDRRLERVRDKIERLKAKKEANELTPADYTKKKSALDNRFRALSARERSIKGIIAQERARIARRTQPAQGAAAR